MVDNTPRTMLEADQQNTIRNQNLQRVGLPYWQIQQRQEQQQDDSGGPGFQHTQAWNEAHGISGTGVTIPDDTVWRQTANRRNAQRGLESSPRYRNPVDLGDAETQRRSQGDYNRVGIALEQQRQEALRTPTLRDDRYFENELALWNAQRIDRASAYHAYGMALGEPIPANPYANTGDLALAFEKAGNKKDNFERNYAFNPNVGSILSLLPQAVNEEGAISPVGLQEFVWDGAVSRDNSQPVSPVSFLPAIEFINSQEGRQGVYGNLRGGIPDTFTPISPQTVKGGLIASPISPVKSAATKDRKLTPIKSATGWNPFVASAAEPIGTISEGWQMPQNNKGSPKEIIITPESDLGKLNGMQIISLEKSTPLSQPPQEGNWQSRVNNAIGGFSRQVGTLTEMVGLPNFVDVLTPIKFPFTNQSIMPGADRKGAQDLGSDWQGRPLKYGEYSKINVGVSDWLVSKGATSPATAEAKAGLAIETLRSPTSSLPSKSIAFAENVRWNAYKEIIENPGDLPVVATQAAIAYPILAVGQTIIGGGTAISLTRAGLKPATIQKSVSLSQQIIPAAFTIGIAGESTKSPSGWFTDFSPENISTRSGKMAPGIVTFMGTSTLIPKLGKYGSKSLEPTINKYGEIQSKAINTVKEPFKISPIPNEPYVKVPFKSSSTTRSPGLIESFVVEGSIQKGNKIVTRSNIENMGSDLAYETGIKDILSVRPKETVLLQRQSKISDLDIYNKAMQKLGIKTDSKTTRELITVTVPKPKIRYQLSYGNNLIGKGLLQESVNSQLGLVQITKSSTYQSLRQAVSPPFKSVLKQTTAPPVKSVLKQTTAPPVKSVLKQTTAPPVKSVLKQTTAPPVKSVLKQTTAPPPSRKRTPNSPPPSTPWKPYNQITVPPPKTPFILPGGLTGSDNKRGTGRTKDKWKHLNPVAVLSKQFKKLKKLTFPKLSVG